MKEQPLKEGIHYYRNDDGFIVLTEQYHLEQGYCCGMGCLHCPYSYESVPEPRKSELRREKSQDRGRRTEEPRP
ncbi:MAG: hypothetical protein JNN29_01265 [Chitinophagaceae bacterium]|nr:hypothetical protein [Chitinophagaceae bacterium]MBN8666490.1 hypothetical protein [Chitinophagales bacterium]